jgi:hypothetical protein
LTTFGDQVREFGGAPVGSGRFSSPWATHYFVDGTYGSANNGGKRPDDAMKTISQAISLASAEDVIYIRPIRSGTDTSGDASDVGWYKPETMVIPFAKHQLSIIGVVHGPGHMYGPMVWYNTTGYVLDVYASALHIENMVLHGEGATGCVNLRGLSGYTASAGACGTTIENCTMGYGSVIVTGGGGTVINKCQFRNCVPALYYDASATPARRHQVHNCTFWQNNGAAIATAYVRVLGTSTEFTMTGCYFDAKTTADEYIYTTGVVDGIIADCYFADDDITWGADAGDEIRIASGSLCPVGCYDNSGGIITTGT